MPKPRLPDRTGILILPSGVFLTAAIFSGVLAWDAWEIAEGTYQRGFHRGAREQLLGDMLASLAGSLGVLPSFALALLLVGAAGAWFVRSVLHFRRRTADDRRAAGLPR